jgi:5'-methylthioadenosine phosphorylase
MGIEGLASAAADIGVFGGSGFSSFLDDVHEVTVETAWGAPSAPVTLGCVGDVRVAFLPRHGVGHHLPPHRVDYRANVATMRALGVRALLAPFAAGSLQPAIHPGEFVVVDQLVDRTSGRVETFHDSFAEGPQHVSLADPYDARLRSSLVDVASAQGLAVHDGGTVVVVNGPRFSTRAESEWFGKMGWDVVNMTQHPEAALAREAGIPFGGVALVTDYDAGLAGQPDIEPVSQERVFEIFEHNLGRLRALLQGVITRWAASSDGAGPPPPLSTPPPLPTGSRAW